MQTNWSISESISLEAAIVTQNWKMLSPTDEKQCLSSTTSLWQADLPSCFPKLLPKGYWNGKLEVHDAGYLK